MGGQGGGSCLGVEGTGRRLEQWAACMECACEVWWAVLWRSYGRVLLGL